MKRLVLIFLFLLPLQASWAAMGAYAHHGEGEEGHHSVLHKQHVDKPASDTSPDKFNHHCSFSHVGGVATPSVFQIALFSPMESYISPYDFARGPAPIPPRPERPNWISAAI